MIGNLRDMGLTQALISDPMAIYYLTGYYTEPYERFFALVLSARSGHPEATLFCNRLFPDASGCCDNVVTFSDTDDPLPLVAAACDPTVALGVDKDLTARWLLPMMDASVASSFVLASDVVDGVRSIKDEDEKDLMRKASLINDEAM